MNNFNDEDYKNILNLISRVANISGQEAMAVASLQMRINNLISSNLTNHPEEVKEEKTETNELNNN